MEAAERSFFILFHLLSASNHFLHSVFKITRMAGIDVALLERRSLFPRKTAVTQVQCLCCQFQSCSISSLPRPPRVIVRHLCILFGCLTKERKYITRRSRHGSNLTVKKVLFFIAMFEQFSFV